MIFSPAFQWECPLDKVFKKIIFLSVFFMGAMSQMAFAENLPSNHPGMPCMVMPDRKAKSKFEFDYSGEKYFFCCRSCFLKFKKAPEKYLEHS